MPRQLAQLKSARKGQQMDTSSGARVGAKVSNPFDELIFKRLLSEVHLLIDFVSGHPEQRIGDMNFNFPKPGAENEMLNTFQTITYICKLGYPPDPDESRRAANAALLLLVKDKLTALAYPARGVTIAYTYCFVEPMGSLRDWIKRLAGRGNDSAAQQTRVTIARDAYPALYQSARRFRGIHRFMICVSIFLTILSALLLWMVAYGAQITSRFEDDRIRNADVEKKIYEQVRAQDAVLPSNERYELIPVKRCDPVLLPYQTIEISLLCNEWAYTQARYEKTIYDACAFAKSWPTLRLMWFFPSEVGNEQHQCRRPKPSSEKAPAASATIAAGSDGTASVAKAALSSPGRESDPTVLSTTNLAASSHQASPTPAKETDPPGEPATQEDVQSVTLVLSIYSNYVLPIFFGFLGTAASMLRSIGNKITDCVLGPRDAALSFFRIPLGMMAGFSVGLFFNPTSVAQSISAGTATLTITASGVAFLAGYGADSFFKIVDGLIGHLFVNGQSDNGKH